MKVTAQDILHEIDRLLKIPEKGESADMRTYLIGYDAALRNLRAWIYAQRAKGGA